MVMQYLLLLMTQKCTFQLLLCQKKIIGILLNKKIKVFNDLFIGTNIKQKKINENADANMFKYINLDPSFQGVNRLFVIAYNRADDPPTRNEQQKYYLPRISLNEYNVIIDGRNFYDNPIESDIKKYRELKKVMIGKGEDYTTGSLLDYNYFDKHYKLVAVDLSKQKDLDRIQEQFNKLNLSICLEQIQLFIGYSKNLKKLY